jgi:hypothetical protein
MAGSINKEGYVPSYPGKKTRSSQKIARIKKARGMTQVIEHLPSKHKALSSNSSTVRKK